jgi:predicted ATPase/class 3 adenylate cyclase
MSAPDDIAGWLDQIGLPEYAPIFAEHAIDGEILADLNDQDLKDLGVPLGHRKKLLKAIAALTQADKATPPRPAPARIEAERRQLTVLFCDLVGSTELAARLDPEDMGQVIRAYQGCCAETVESWGGHIAKYMGDGVLTYFGWPQAHEDDAERAVRAGLTIVRVVAELATPAGVPLAARVGIATGLVMVGELIGEEEARERAVVGETPNLAARLQALAAPGGVVISQATRRLVGGLFELADLGPRRLKGFAEPLAAWRVEGECRIEGRFEALHGEHLTPLVGREHELGILLERWAWAKDGDGQVMLLSGEPGIGKSRLVREVRARLSEEPHIRLLYQCSPHHTTSPLHPVIEQLERAAGFERDDTSEVRLDKLDTLLARGTEKLDQAVPLIAAVLGLPAGARYLLPELTPQRQKRLTLEALVDQLEGLAANQPVFLTYEDVHWIDPTTLEFVALAIERLQCLAVLCVVTFRPEFAPPWTGLPYVSALPLTRLGRRDGAALVERVARAKLLPADVSARIVDKTDGVPLFVEELTKTVLESGLLHDRGDHYELSGPLPPLAIPSTLHDSLLARLDRTPAMKAVARTAACIGREFDYRLLEIVADVPPRELAEGLEGLLRAELVFRRGTTDPATYSFKHALIRDAAYRSLLRQRRRVLHGRIVDALGHEDAGTPAEVLAFHAAAAGRCEQAARLWTQAAHQAFTRSAFGEVVAHATAALRQLALLPSTHARDRSELRLQMLLGTALINAKGYTAPGAARAYARARELCHGLSEHRQLLPVLWGQFVHHLTTAAHQRARAIAEEMVKAAGHREGRAHLFVAHRCVGSSAWYRGQLSCAREALAQAMRLCSPELNQEIAAEYPIDQLSALRCYDFATLCLSGHPARAHAEASIALGELSERTQPASLAHALHFACLMHQWCREPEAVHQTASAMLRLANEQILPFWRVHAYVLRGSALADLNHPEQGIVELRRGLDLNQGSGYRANLPYFLGLLAGAYARNGEQNEALATNEQALVIAGDTDEGYYLAELQRQCGDLLLAQGEVDRAATAFALSIETAERQGANWWKIRASSSLSRLWAEQGRRAEAHDLLTPAYGWFTEGFDTADLKDAKALLDELR